MAIHYKIYYLISNFFVLPKPILSMFALQETIFKLVVEKLRNTITDIQYILQLNTNYSFQFVKFNIKKKNLMFCKE